MSKHTLTASTIVLALSVSSAQANRVCLQVVPDDPDVEQVLTASLLRQQVAVSGPPGGSSGGPCDMHLTAGLHTTGYQLSAALVASQDGGLLAEETVTGTTDQVFDLVDRLGQRLVRSLAALPEPGTVTVLAFDNHASPESNAFVSGMPHMLLTTLRQQRQWTLVDAPAIGPADVDTDSDVAHQLGADVAVQGQFTEMLSLQMNVDVVASGRSLGDFEAVGSRADIGHWADRVASDVAAAIEGHRRTMRTVAVLPFLNHGEREYERFVDGLADMLTTSLGQSPRLIVIERVQIETAMRNFNVEMSGPIDSETAVRVGAWLGADAVVVGSFLRFGQVFRIDARMIDAQTGEVLVADRASGAEDAVMGMVDDLGHKLVERFEDRVPVEAAGTGTLEIVFRMTKAEMGERPSYHHLAKLYVDGQYMETSPVVQRLDRWEPLFSRRLSSGPHRVQIVHGYVRDSAWDGRMPLQPDVFDVTIEPESTTTLRYGYEVGWFKDRFLAEH